MNYEEKNKQPLKKLKVDFGDLLGNIPEQVIRQSLQHSILKFDEVKKNSQNQENENEKKWPDSKNPNHSSFLD